LEQGKAEGASGQASCDRRREPILIREAVGLIRDKMRGLLATILILAFAWVAVREGALTELQVLAATALAFYFGARSNGNGKA